MRIRKSKSGDKRSILSFCQNTFRWGDYIDRVWDLWLSRRNLYTAEVSGKPIGICNISFSKNQIWLEGLRINPKFRRRGYASRLILKAEEIGKQRHRKISRMLIAKNNARSLNLAKSLGYEIEEKWWLYNLRPKKQTTKTRPADNVKQIESLLCSNTYSESWEWFSLDKTAISKLTKKGRVVLSSKNKRPTAVGIWNKSQIDKGIVQIGFLNGTKMGMDEILRFMQNKAYLLKSKRIQVLVQQKITLKMEGLEKRMLFCLMKKDLT